MKKLLLLLSLLLATNAWAVEVLSELPACKGDSKEWNNCFGRESFDGGEYKGEYVSGKRHGQGTYLWESGNKYIGSFKKGVIQGQGTFIWTNGDKYEGEFKDNKMQGQGSKTKVRGSEIVRMVGEFKDGELNGQGTETFTIANEAGEMVSIGEFKNGLLHGQGELTWSDGTKYEGEWKDGEMDGKCSFIMGKKLSEYFSAEDKEAGIKLPRGFSYEGQSFKGNCKNGLPHGWGISTLPNGWRYEGEFLNGYEHGQATEILPMLGIVEGEYENGELVYGTISYRATGEKAKQVAHYNFGTYVGEFSYYAPQGQGTFTYANGNKYVGSWDVGAEHGQGSTAYTNGDKHVGKYVYGSQIGLATMYYADGDKYQGGWKKGNKDGLGMTTYADGTIEKGSYRKGKFRKPIKSNRDKELLKEFLITLEENSKL